MDRIFPADASPNNLRWAVLLALLIDTPFLVGIFWGGASHTFSLLIIVVPVVVSALIVYSSYAAGRMVYVLEKDSLRIRFPLSPLRIGYGKIRHAGKVETRLRFRLFGGSLPGSHWGLFSTSNFGNVQVYATRYKGEFLLLELIDGTRFLISPREPDALLEALGDKTSFTSPALLEVAEPRLDKRLVYMQVALVGVAWLAFIGFVCTIYPRLPEVIPVHFGFDGIPNRYGNKIELLFLAAMSALFPGLNTIFSIKYGRYNRGLTIFLSAVFLFAIGLFALVVNQILQAI